MFWKPTQTHHYEREREKKKQRERERENPLASSSRVERRGSGGWGRTRGLCSFPEGYLWKGFFKADPRPVQGKPGRVVPLCYPPDTPDRRDPANLCQFATLK
ncbi:hypothetical protein CCH79_00003601, partial [Gambusia affinis]